MCSSLGENEKKYHLHLHHRRRQRLYHLYGRQYRLDIDNRQFSAKSFLDSVSQLGQETPHKSATAGWS